MLGCPEPGHGHSERTHGKDTLEGSDTCAQTEGRAFRPNKDNPRKNGPLSPWGWPFVVTYGALEVAGPRPRRNSLTPRGVGNGGLLSQQFSGLSRGTYCGGTWMNRVGAFGVRELVSGGRKSWARGELDARGGGGWSGWGDRSKNEAQTEQTPARPAATSLVVVFSPFEIAGAAHWCGGLGSFAKEENRQGRRADKKTGWWRSVFCCVVAAVVPVNRLRPEDIRVKWDRTRSKHKVNGLVGGKGRERWGGGRSSAPKSRSLELNINMWDRRAAAGTRAPNTGRASAGRSGTNQARKSDMLLVADGYRRASIFTKT